MAKKGKGKQYLVVGLGRFGSAIAETLCLAGEEVLGVDIDLDLVEDMRERITHTVQMDAMDRSALMALGVEDFDVAFVTMGSDIRASGMITLLMKELGVKRVIAKAHDDFHGRMLEKLGADEVLFPERDMGRRIAHNLVSGNIIDYLELSPDYSMAEIRPKPEWPGKSLRELALRSSMGVNVVAIRNGETLNPMPQPETVIAEGDVLLVVASEKTLAGMDRWR
ncbi:MAG: TrkA family potassium uptake protein [Clostridia bacterium]|nr:TrkA family potassium uptake protein [Clostridia bacterium]